MNGSENTHTKWKVYNDATLGLVRVRYPLDPNFDKIERQYGVAYRNKKAKGPAVLIHWLTEAEHRKKVEMHGG